MARTVRAVSGPRGGTKSIGAGVSMRILSGSMGAAPEVMPVTEELGVAERFEAPAQDDSKWADEIRRREAEAGLPRADRIVNPPMVMRAPPISLEPGTVPAGWTPPRHDADFSSLPPRFAVEIERKDDRWKVTAPAVHLGLWKSGPDLMTVVGDALAALAEMVSVDGVVPAPKKRKTR